MAEYKTIKGFTVQNLSSDPASSALAAGAWAAGNTMNNLRFSVDVYQSETQTASMATGGYDPPSGSLAVNEQWNGSTWSEVSDLPTAKSNGMGCGTNTAAFTGFGLTTTNVNTTETWNGTSWTSANAGNTARRHGGQFGASGQGIAASGFISPGPRSPAVEKWDGTNWTEVAEMSSPRDTSAGLGVSSTLGLIAGGSP